MKKIWTNEVGRKTGKRVRMHWRTWEVRQNKNALAHLGSAPVQKYTGALPKCAQAEQKAYTVFWCDLIHTVTDC